MSISKATEAKNRIRIRNLVVRISGSGRVRYVSEHHGSVTLFLKNVFTALVHLNAKIFLSFRDGFPCDWQNILLCAGASEGIRACLKLMTRSQIFSSLLLWYQVPVMEQHL